MSFKKMSPIFTDMIYYQITLYTNREDDFNKSVRLKGGLKAIKWLKYDGADNDLQIDQEREDESLAMKILIKNLQQVEEQLLATTDSKSTGAIGQVTRYIKNEDDLKRVIDGHYKKVMVKKYESDVIRR